MTKSSDLSKVDGLQQILEVLHVSNDFDERCEHAADVAWQVRKLRAEKQKLGFRRIGFRKYVEELARGAGAQADTILEWFGIRELADVNECRQAARLARGVGLSLREYLAHLRIEFAVRRKEPVAALNKIAGGLAQADSLEDCEAALARIQWDAETARLLQLIERTAATEYE